MANQDEPIIFSADDMVCVATWRNVLLCDVCRDVDAAALRRMAEAAEPMLKQHPDGMVSLSIMRHGIGVPSADARQESKRLSKARRGVATRTVVVIEPGGLMASLIQTALRGLNIVNDNKMQMATSLEAGCRMVAPLVKPEATGAVVAAAVAALRVAYGERVPAARIAR